MRKRRIVKISKSTQDELDSYFGIGRVLAEKYSKVILDDDSRHFVKDGHFIKNSDQFKVGGNWYVDVLIERERRAEAPNTVRNFVLFTLFLVGAFVWGILKGMSGHQGEGVFVPEPWQAGGSRAGEGHTGRGGSLLDKYGDGYKWSLNESKIIRDDRGRIMIEVGEEGKIRDAQGKIMGEVKEATRDAYGRKVIEFGEKYDIKEKYGDRRIVGSVEKGVIRDALGRKVGNIGDYRDAQGKIIKPNDITDSDECITYNNGRFIIRCDGEIIDIDDGEEVTMGEIKNVGRENYSILDYRVGMRGERVRVASNVPPEKAVACYFYADCPRVSIKRVSNDNISEADNISKDKRFTIGSDGTIINEHGEILGEARKPRMRGREGKRWYGIKSKKGSRWYGIAKDESVEEAIACFFYADCPRGKKE